MKQITNNTEFIIGIDFGHGETSASFYALHDNRTESKKDLNITNGKDVIKSAVAILRQEGVDTIAVGDRAIQEAPVAKDFQVSFKKRPSEMNEIERGRMVAFMKGVYEGILEQYPDFKSREHVVFIARPSQDKLWKSEEVDYIKIAEDAGLPVAGIQKESRAAYFRARTQPDSKIDKQVDKGVLIVDFGSSTIDFTYLNKNLKQPIDDGVNLGASAVEETLLRYSFLHPMDDDPMLTEFYKLYGKNRQSNAYNQLLYKFRVAKESFYENNQQKFGLDYRYNDLTSAEDHQLLGRGGVEYSRAEVRRILTEEFDHYIPKIEAAVRKFKDQKLKGNKVACVYLTGGASQMDFVREIFMKVFNLKAEQCPKDDHASVIVSQGVSHLSYADYKTEEKGKELETIINGLIENFPWNETIKKVIYDAVKSDIKSSACHVMTEWKNGKIYETINENKTTNLNALKKAFQKKFATFSGLNFAQKCSSVIEEELIKTVVSKIKDTFNSFQYNVEVNDDVMIENLSASLKKSGIEELTEKFIGEGPGHMIYDSIASRNLMMKDHLNYTIVRLDHGRRKHFENYNYSIYDDDYWKKFLDKHLKIEGIENAKVQTKRLVKDMLNEYISYAKLSIFYN